MSEQYVATGSRTFQILSASGVAVGSAIDFGAARSKFTMQTIVTGAPATVSVTLQGSLDGLNWSTLATSTSTTGDQQYSIDKPQKFVRANLGTLTGGTAPTVSVFVAAGT